jgi:hypothetical protein
MTGLGEWHTFTGNLIRGGFPNTLTGCTVLALEHRREGCKEVTYTRITITDERPALSDGHYDLSFAGKTIQKVQRLSGAFKNNGNLSLN